jgi:hypothetical protein
MRVMKATLTFVIVAQRIAIPVGKGISISILAFPSLSPGSTHWSSTGDGPSPTWRR